MISFITKIKNTIDGYSSRKGRIIWFAVLYLSALIVMILVSFLIHGLVSVLIAL